MVKKLVEIMKKKKLNILASVPNAPVPMHLTVSARKPKSRRMQL